ncbi:MAG: hypothetical protein RMN52_14765 [Anaerolineae bacterium]|nr:hypothetical protein [Candidatus Roseilinea sp.]MDW8451259.1 hypothetical protein [Anaerolineae bacterium]
MHRTNAPRRIAAITALASLFLLPAPARADIAPPEQAPGSNIQPAGATQVQMAAERVVIEVLRVKGARDTGLPVANVVASFTMRNTGNAAETMTVRFPLSDPSGQGDGFGGHPEIEQVIVTVNGKRTPTRVVTTPNPRSGSEPPIRWAAFDVTFPPGEDVAIDVRYILQSTGYMPYGRFKYILETGAGWAGPIGLATFVVKLPYPANGENVVLGRSTPGGQFSGDEVRWTFKDLEPTEQDNFYVTVLAPSVWERILEARRRTEATPKSAAAWRELAQAYLSAVYGRYSPEIGANFVPLIEEAYRRAQENDPTSAQLHAEWAQALLSLYPPILELDPIIVEKIFAALKAAFERDPSNPLAQKVLSEMRDWLTQRAASAGAEAETAKKQLEKLEQIVRQTGAAQFAATPTAGPTAGLAEATATSTPVATPLTTITATVAPTATPAATIEATVPSTPAAEPSPTAEAAAPATEPVVSSSIVTSTTETGTVITATTVSTATTTLTDTVTSQPVVVITVQESRTVTETAGITGTVPATVTEASATTIITTTPSEAAGIVITATVVTTATKALDETGAVRPESPGVITSTTVTTATTEASPFDPTRPATVTVIVAQTTISPTVTITRPAETGEPTTVETTVTSSVVSTATTGIAEPGALPSTSIITETEVVTTTIEPARTEGAAPVINVITETTVVTATVDSSGAITLGTPVTVVVTGAPTEIAVTPQATATNTPEPAATPVAPPTSEATALAEVATPAPVAEATPAAPAATAPPAGQGLQPATWFALLLTYAAGGAAVYGIHSVMIRRDRQRAEQRTESQNQVLDSTTDQPPADL